MSKINQISLQEAVGMIDNGSFMTFGGFTTWRRPMAFVYEMIRQGKKDLHLFEVNGSTHTEMLVGAGCVKIFESCWVGHELLGKLGEGIARHQVADDGVIIIDDISHGQCVARIVAGAYGLPFMPCAMAMGTDLLNPEYDMLGRAGLRDGSNPNIPKKKYEVYKNNFTDTGTDILLMPAANPEWGIMYIPMIGDEGTCRVFAQNYVDSEVIKACKKIIVVTEEIVPESYLRQQPGLNIAPGHMIDYVVECKWSAHPTGSQNYYDVDADFIRAFYKASKSQEAYDKWAKEWIYGVSSHEEYLEKLGVKHLETLRANSAIGYSTSIKRGTR